jgi:hypothetical protein
MPHAFGNDERIAAEYDRDMMVPAWETASLEVVEPEFPLQILVGTLRSPSLHHRVNQLLSRCSERHRRQEVVRRLRLSVSPLDEQPKLFSFARWTCWIVERRYDAAHREFSGQVFLGSLSPRGTSESAIGFDVGSQLAHRDALFGQFARGSTHHTVVLGSTPTA